MALSHSPQIVRDGLVLYLDAANIKSYPGTGTTWFDLKGNHTGTFINGALYSINDKGSIILDGADDYVNISNPELLNPGINSFTLNCWVKQFSNNRYNGLIEARGTGLHGFLFILNWNGTGRLGLFLNTTNDTSQNTYNTTVSTFTEVNEWMNVSVVVNRINETIEFYKNGEKQGNTVNIISGGSTDPGSSYRYWIGGDLGGPEANASFGIIQQYNRALTALEIKNNFEAIRGRYGI